MTPSVLVSFASRHGSTREVAETVALTLRERGLRVELAPATEVADVSSHDGVVLGSALYTGRVHRDARRFLKRHRAALSQLRLAVFAMGPRTLDESDVAQSRTQLERELARVPEIQPVSIEIFGGVVDPAKLHFPFNRMPATDARDWDAIRNWADEIADLYAVAQVSAAAAL